MLEEEDYRITFDLTRDREVLDCRAIFSVAGRTYRRVYLSSDVGGVASPDGFLECS